jgi:hypothetical protein
MDMRRGGGKRGPASAASTRITRAAREFWERCGGDKSLLDVRTFNSTEIQQNVDFNVGVEIWRNCKYLAQHELRLEDSTRPAGVESEVTS